jgi:CheY-like chemotaxis protein
MRLLVIDDSLTIRKLVELSFKGQDCTIDYATTGRDGVTKAASGTPDLILLDYVLPDMNASDVCQHLGQDERSAQVPVILMSAKNATIREQFTKVRSVVDFIGKPFTAEEVVERVGAALKKKKPKKSAPRAEVAAQPGLSFAQKEAAAKIVYTRLKDNLAHIPEWTDKMGAAQPAPFFAKKILTPDLMASLLDALVPFYKDLFQGFLAPMAAVEGVPRAVPGEGVRFTGDLAGWSVLDVIRSIAGNDRTGELHLHFGDRQAILYWRAGEILMVSNHDPERFCKDSGVDLGQIPAESREKAWAEHRSSAKPVYVTLAEAGLVAPAELPDLLRRQGTRVLVEALEAPACRFYWKPNSALPLHVEAHGRRISADSLTLEMLRRAEGPSTTIAGEIVFERVPGFSHRVRQFNLSPEERQVLTLVNGRNPLTRIAERSGMATASAGRILGRLQAVSLIRIRETVSVPTTASDLQRNTVMILEPDIEGVQRPLARMLMDRSQPMDLVALEGDRRPGELVATITERRPRAVIVNASAAEKVARALCNTADLTDLSLVALLDVPNVTLADELLAAGFDAVFTKPAHFSDIERYLGNNP